MCRSTPSSSPSAETKKKKKILQPVFETVLTERNEIPQFFSQLIITAIRQVSISRPVHGSELGVEIQSCAINARPRVLEGASWVNMVGGGRNNAHETLKAVTLLQSALLTTCPFQPQFVVLQVREKWMVTQFFWGFF